MAVGIKALADGQLSGSKATIYTVPTSTRAIVRSIILVNTDSEARIVNIYANRTGNSRHIAPKNLSIAAGGYVSCTDIVTLEASQVIEGEASAANVVDYVISGVEET